MYLSTLNIMIHSLVYKVIFVGLISKYIFHFIIICYTLDVNLNLIKMCPPISTFWLPFIFIQIKSPPDSKQFICLLFTEKICRLSKYSNFCKPFDNFWVNSFIEMPKEKHTYNVLSTSECQFCITSL